MIKLDLSLQAWGTLEFSEILKQEIAQLGTGNLPLQQGLASGNYVIEAPLTVLIHSANKLDNIIRVKAGIFYQGVMGGCSCTDDPTPISDLNEYCELQFDINCESAVASVALII